MSDHNFVDKTKAIANHYGYETQSRQCIEEMAELTKELNKFWRHKCIKCEQERSLRLAIDREHITEEIADVQIMLFQMQELLGIDGERVLNIVDEKLDRQLIRIAEEEKECQQ